MTSTSSSSSSSSTYETVLEVELPDHAFEPIKRSLLQLRRHSQPTGIPKSEMTYHTTSTRRTTYDTRSSSFGGSMGGANGAVQPPALPRAYTTSATDNANGYASSNVTGYRSRLDVEGLPEKHYFTSHASKHDRRPQYIRHSSNGGQVAGNGYHASKLLGNGYVAGNGYHASNLLSNGYVAANGYQASQSLGNGYVAGAGGGYTAGNELMKYRGGQYVEDDAGTIVPDDSISQVSSHRSRRSKHSRSSNGSSPLNHVHRYSSDEQGRLYEDNLSTYEGQPVYDDVKEYWTTERKPGRSP